MSVHCPSVEYGTARTPSTRHVNKQWRRTPHATLLLGLGRVAPLLAAVHIPVVGVERVSGKCLARLRLVRDHLPRGRLRGPLSYFKRQAHRVRSSFLKSFLPHPYTLVVHGQQRFQRAALRREDILRLAELPGLPPELAVGDLCC